jgi:hypothetical protein
MHCKPGAHFVRFDQSAEADEGLWGAQNDTLRMSRSSLTLLPQFSFLNWHLRTQLYWYTLCLPPDPDLNALAEVLRLCAKSTAVRLIPSRHCYGLECLVRFSQISRHSANLPTGRQGLMLINGTDIALPPPIIQLSRDVAGPKSKFPLCTNI